MKKTERACLNRNMVAVMVLFFTGLAFFTACPQPDGETPPARYNITLTQPSGGGTFSVQVGSGAPGSANTTANQGAVITLTAVPPEGSYLAGFVVKTVSGESVTVVISGNTGTFTMPAKGVTVTVSFLDNSVVHSIYSGETKPGAALAIWEGGGNGDTETVDGRSGGYALRFTSAADWGGFSFNLNAGLNFNNFDALSFWVKSPDGAVIETGFASGEWEVGYKGEENTGIVVGTDWQRVVVPVPVNRTVAGITQAFFVNGNGLFGKTIHVDDIELIRVETTLNSVEIDSSGADEPILPYPSKTPVTSLFTPALAEYTVDGVDVTLRGGFLQKWLEFQYDITGDAVLDGFDIVPKADGETFTLTVSFDGKSKQINGTINSKQLLALADFTYMAGDIGAAGSGYWANSWWASVVEIGGRKGAAHIVGMNSRGIGRRDQAWDLSGYGSVAFSIYANTADGDNPSVIGTVYRFGLITGNVDNEGAGDGTVYYAPDISVTAEMNGNWVKITIPLSEFEDGEGNPLPLNPTINGWRFVGAENAGGVIYIDNIYAEEAQGIRVSVNAEADFSGLPTNIALKKTGAETMEIALEKFENAKWYVDGKLAGSEGVYTLEAAELGLGIHTLSVVVTVDGLSYSKTVNFMIQP